MRWLNWQYKYFNDGGRLHKYLILLCLQLKYYNVFHICGNSVKPNLSHVNFTTLLYGLNTHGIYYTTSNLLSVSYSYI